jgi:hypothetical protein
MVEVEVDQELLVGSAGSPGTAGAGGNGSANSITGSVLLRAGGGGGGTGLSYQDQVDLVVQVEVERTPGSGSNTKEQLEQLTLEVVVEVDHETLCNGVAGGSGIVIIRYKFQ